MIFPFYLEEKKTYIVHVYCFPLKTWRFVSYIFANNTHKNLHSVIGSHYWKNNWELNVYWTWKKYWVVCFPYGWARVVFCNVKQIYQWYMLYIIVIVFILTMVSKNCPMVAMEMLCFCKSNKIYKYCIYNVYLCI